MCIFNSHSSRILWFTQPWILVRAVCVEVHHDEQRTGSDRSDRGTQWNLNLRFESIGNCTGGVEGETLITISLSNPFFGEGLCVCLIRIWGCSSSSRESPVKDYLGIHLRHWLYGVEYDDIEVVSDAQIKMWSLVSRLNLLISHC